MIQDRIRREIFGDFAEAGGERRLAARAADAAFGVANNAGFAGDRPGFDQGPDREVGGGRIAAGIRDQPRAGDPGTAELRQSVGGLGEKSGLRVRRFVPALVVFRSPQAEGAAQVDDLDACVQQRAASIPWRLPEESREIPPRSQPRELHHRCTLDAGAPSGRAAEAGPRHRDAPAGWAPRADDAKEYEPVPRRCSRGNRGCRRESWAHKDYRAKPPSTLRRGIRYGFAFFAALRESKAAGSRAASTRVVGPREAGNDRC